MKFKNPFERTPRQKPTIGNLTVDYLDTQGRINTVKADDQRESEQRGEMFGTFDKKEREKDAKSSAEIIKELEARLQDLRKEGVTDEHLKEAEKRLIDYMEAQLTSYEEYVKQSEIELAALEATNNPDDLGKISRLREHLYGENGAKKWVDRYASEERARFAEQRKSLEGRY